MIKAERQTFAQSQIFFVANCRLFFGQQLRGRCYKTLIKWANAGFFLAENLPVTILAILNSFMNSGIVFHGQRQRVLRHTLRRGGHI